MVLHGRSDGRPSAVRAVQAHLAESAVDNLELLVVESLDEEPGHPLEVDGDRLQEAFQAGLGQPARDEDPLGRRMTPARPWVI